jgi:hypothetical protein
LFKTLIGPKSYFFYTKKVWNVEEYTQFSILELIRSPFFGFETRDFPASSFNGFGFMTDIERFCSPPSDQSPREASLRHFQTIQVHGHLAKWVE